MRKVKELIKFLQKCDPEDHVYGYEGEVDGIVVAFHPDKVNGLNYTQAAFFDNRASCFDEYDYDKHE
jgi:hypothetical protein